jgi:PiT family inorganic phosphate transporter
VLGAGLLGLGSSAIDWAVVAEVFPAWLLAPLVSALVAASLVAFVETSMIYQSEKISAVRR